jgi:hypothetical protein
VLDAEACCVGAVGEEALALMEPEVPKPCTTKLDAGTSRLPWREFWLCSLSGCGLSRLSPSLSVWDGLRAERGSDVQVGSSICAHICLEAAPATAAGSVGTEIARSVRASGCSRSEPRSPLGPSNSCSCVATAKVAPCPPALALAPATAAVLFGVAEDTADPSDERSCLEILAMKVLMGS